MLIIWGSRARQQQRGVVADRCETCRGIALFAVIDVYKVSHLYYISLGAGTIVATAMKCLGCATERTFVPQQYGQVVKSQAPMTVQDVLQQSNPRLFQQMSQAAVPQIPVTPPAGSLDPAGGGDDRAPAALQRLNDLAEIDAASNMLRLRLLTWHTLDEASRTVLLEDVEAYVRDRKHERRASRLLGMMSAVKPSAAGLAAFWALVVAVPLALHLLLPSLGMARLLIWAVAILIAYREARRFAEGLDKQWYREWFRKSVIPSAENSQVSLPLLCAMMRDGQSPADASVLSYADVLRGVAQELGKWSSDDHAAPRAAMLVPLPPRPRFPRLGEVYAINFLALLIVTACQVASLGANYVPPATARRPAPPAAVAQHPSTSGAGSNASSAATPPSRPAVSMPNTTVASAPQVSIAPAPHVTVAQPAPARTVDAPAPAPARTVYVPAPARTVYVPAPARTVDVPAPARTVDVPAPAPHDQARPGFRLANGQPIPPELMPRSDAPPGIENAWTSSAFDQIPRGLKTVFRPNESVFISFLYIDVRPEQSIDIKIHRDRVGDEPDQDWNTRMEPKNGSGFSGMSLANPSRGLRLGRYTISFFIDGRDVRHLTFDVVR